MAGGSQAAGSNEPSSSQACGMQFRHVWLAARGTEPVSSDAKDAHEAGSGGTQKMVVSGEPGWHGAG